MCLLDVCLNVFYQSVSSRFSVPCCGFLQTFRAFLCNLRRRGKVDGTTSPLYIIQVFSSSFPRGRPLRHHPPGGRRGLPRAGRAGAWLGGRHGGQPLALLRRPAAARRLQLRLAGAQGQRAAPGAALQLLAPRKI